MQQNWQQGQYGGGYGGQQQQQQQPGGGGFMGSQPTGFGMMGSQPTGFGGMGMGMSGMGGMGGGVGQQPTGFPQQQQQQQQQPQPTGFQPQQQRGNISPLPTGQPQQQQGGYSFLNTQPTGFRPSFTGSSGLNSQMTGFQGGGASGLLSQPTGFGGGGGGMMSQPTGMGGSMMSQPTGMGGLRAQPTGVHDPRLQTMMQSFMPSNMSQPFNPSGAPQFNQPSAQPLQQQFQSLLQNPSVKTPKVPWVLTKQEKKDYDQIFKAWDQDGDGFITGETSREVFGQSGLDQDSLMKIWTLSDVDNRGKLNLPEFHVAMGLIYRALNGNEIPDRLPEELIPASMRDIDTTVSFMRDLLKHEANTRSNTSSPSYGSSTPVGGGASKDATAYKHDDTRPSGYKPSSRHLDRKSVRYAGEDSSADIGDIRRQLANTSAMLDKSNDDYMRKTEEDEQLEQDVDDLKYRVKRIQDDIEYLTKGRRSADKDEERRKLEREMLFLMHEKLPELERRQKQREEDKRMEERAGVRARDRRNDTHGRYRDDRDRDRDRDDDRDWLRGSYDRDRDRDRSRRDSRDRDRSRDRYDDRSRDRSRDRYDRPRSPPRSRTPPPAPPPAPAASSVAPPPPAPPAPTSNATAAPSTKNMTAEERSAFIREQAQRRIQERLKALGVESGSSTPTEQPAVDKSVEERLEREKREAEEKSKSAEREQEAREEARRQRLQGGGATPKAVEDDKPATAGSTPSSPAAPLKSAMKKAPAAPPAPPASRGKVPPPAPKPRQPAAPPSAAPAPAAKAAEAEEEDPEEAELRRKEEARAKAKEDRRARLAALEAEEEEERKQEEARLAARQTKSTPATSPAPASAPQSPPPPAAGGGDHNPFRKPGHPTAASSGGGGGFNPFFKPQALAAASPSPAATPSSEVTSPAAAPPPPPPPPPAPPAPAAAAPAPTRAPPTASTADDEWERIEEKTDDSDDDSSDDDYANSRTKRAGLASALFGNITGGGGANRSGSSTPTPAAPKAPPPAALANLGGGTPSGGGMSALLSSIQGGARLKKAQTVDKSGPGVSGRVIGGADVPEHINASEPPAANGQAPAEADEEDDVPDRNPNRQSVDWLGGLAADHSRGTVPGNEYMPLEATQEEAEPLSTNGNGTSTPAINVQPAESADELDEFDLTKTIRVRTLFPYDGQRDVDLSFIENVVIEAHPAKDPQSPWWYGTLVKEGKKGWFPHTYVDELKPVQAKASFTYDGQSEDELPFVEGDVLTIVDTSDSDWWKTEKAGVIFIVPASYFELLGSNQVETSSLAGAGQESGAAMLSLDSPPRLGTDSTPAHHSRHEDLPHISTSSKPHDDLLSPRSRPPSTSIPAISARPRSSTVNSATTGGSGYESSSSEDSMLSFWSDDDGSEDEDGETAATTTGTEDEPPVTASAPDVGQLEKEAERRRREEERQKVLEQAGLKIRREPPGVPGQTKRKNTRRRPAPVPGKGKGKRRPAPGVPPPSQSNEREGEESGTEGKQDTPDDAKLDTLDAYARYENYLAQAQTRQRSGSTPTPAPAAVSPRTATPPIPLAAQHSGSANSTRPGRSSSITSPQSSSMGSGGGRFSGLISRIMAPSSSGMGEQPRKSISIVRVDDGGAGSDGSGAGTGSATPAAMDSVGRTWTSLVESSVLETMSDKERKRQEAIFEFIATEGSYNRDLQIIVEAFYATMLDMLDEKALTVIFANIEDILLTATAFLSSLEQRQKACRLYVDVIGDILEEHIPRMRVYMTYCVNQQQAIKLLQSQRESNPALAAHLQTIRETNPAVRGLDLSSFLLIPMQRITRYPLLLRQILQYTSSDQDFPAVQSALNEAENITAAINESVRDAEGDERLRVLSEDLWIGGEGRLDLTAPTAYQGPRKLLKEGLVTKAKSGRKLTMILCNDIVVLVESRNLYRMPIPLHEVQAREGREEAFQLKVEYHRGGDTVGLKASSAREAKEWVSMINKHRALTLEARNEVDRRRHHGFSF